MYRFGLLSSTWNTNFLGTVTANVLYSTVSVEFSVKIFPDIIRSDMVFAGNKYKGHKSIVRNGVLSPKLDYTKPKLNFELSCTLTPVL